MIKKNLILNYENNMKGKTIFLLLAIFIHFNLLGKKLGPLEVTITFEPENG